MLFDLHNDFPTRFFYADYCGFCSTDRIVTAVVWTSELTDAENAVNGITARLSHCSSLPIAIEDIGFLAECEKYKRFDFSRYFYCSLTWNHNNGFAGGALDDGQLTERGKSAIRAIEDSGCYIDLAHLNKKSFLQVLDCAKNVLCSHTGFNTHPRSLDDEQIKLLLERNAVIGLCTVRAFTDAYSIDQFADVIDTFVQKYGSDGLALGTDFNGSDDIPNDMDSYDKLVKLKDILMGRGYDCETVNKIFFKNAQSIYNRFTKALDR